MSAGVSVLRKTDKLRKKQLMWATGLESLINPRQF